MQRKKSRSFKKRPGKARASRTMREAELRRGRITIYCPMFKSFPTALMKPKKGAALTIRQLVEGDSFQTHTNIGAAGFIQVPVLVGNPIDMTFALADLPQKASWEAVFDQYRIDEIEVHLIPVYNVVDAHGTASPNNGCPPSVIVLDYDDNTSLASITAAFEYDNSQIITPYQGAVVKVRPKITPAMYAGAFFTGYGVEDSAEGPWLDVASDTVDHYGIKMWVNPLANASTETLGWYAYAQYTISFANVR